MSFCYALCLLYFCAKAVNGYLNKVFHYNKRVSFGVLLTKIIITFCDKSFIHHVICRKMQVHPETY